MKKYFFILIIFLFPITCLANNISFKLESDLYTNIIKKEDKDYTIFEINNNINSVHVTNKELKKILNQKSNSKDNPLAIFSVLKINNVRDNYYLNMTDSWVSNINYYLKEGDYVELKDKRDSILIYNYSISYRKDYKSPWLYTVPKDFKYYDKTMEEKLSILLGIDKSEVINQYNKLFKFRVLPNGYMQKIRLDFYEESDGMLPIQVSSNHYLSKTLNNIDTKYVIIKHNRIESMENILLANEKSNINFFSLFLFISVIILTVILYKKYNKVYNFNS